MTFKEYLKEIEAVYNDDTVRGDDIVEVEAAIVSDADLTVYDKGYLVSCFLDHPEIRKKDYRFANKVARIGSQCPTAFYSVGPAHDHRRRNTTLMYP